MKLQEYWNCYNEMSGKASEIARTLSLSAIALIWVFKLEAPDGVKLPPELLVPAALIVVAMTLDFVQYLYLALAWRVYARNLEVHKADPAVDYAHRPWIPFVGKVMLVLIAYFHLAEYLWRRVF
jgi:hypothetical protein